MVLTDARRLARTDSSGAVVPLDEQDRALWNRVAIAEGVALLTAVLPKHQLGPYQVQAAIAAVHDEAPHAEDTDWPQILGLYDVLLQLSESPVVALNHAVAVAMVHGIPAGLERLEAVAADERLAGSHRLDAVRAHLLDRQGDRSGAAVHYRRAASRTTSEAERDYLLLRAARLDSR
ncbi:MAG: hypothetical protein JNG84_01295 [Archangium sp.]|nr:hypothetical protein [Archangium sp.]